jgi:hypothetical protein
LGFLGRKRIRRENPFFGYWIVLDFLGFSRPKRDLSMGYAVFSSIFYPPASAAAKERSGRLSRSGVRKEAQLFMARA